MKTILIGITAAVALALSAPAFAGSGGGAAPVQRGTCGHQACDNDADDFGLADLTLDSLITRVGAWAARVMQAMEAPAAPQT